MPGGKLLGLIAHFHCTHESLIFPNYIYQHSGWLIVSRNIDPATRERVLDAAEKLFTERGFAAVKLRDIAQAVGLNHASLYHHAPGGKEELYIEVMRRGLQRHQAGLQGAIAGAGDDWQAQLRAAARWLISQPPMDITRMRTSDMPALSKQHARRLNDDVYALLLAPIQQVFLRGAGADFSRSMLFTGMFLFMLESVHSAPAGTVMTPQQMADEMLNVMIKGLVD
jgi:AcrR family transcriptional regulator